MATDGGEPPERDPAASDGLPDASDDTARLRDRMNPVSSALAAGLDSGDAETVENCGIALCLVARSQPSKASTIVSQLVEMIVEQPRSEPLYRTLAGLVGDHGREIRGALLTETGYSDARKIYGTIEHADPWELSAVEIEPPTEDDAEPTFFSTVMRLVEAEEQGRDPLDSDAWTRFIQRLPGEGGDPNEKGVERAANRQDSRPRAVRRRHEQIEEIATSRTFLAIEARSRFDDLEVLAPISEQRFAHVIRTRGRIGAEEYAIAIRLCKQCDDSSFRATLTDSLREWAQLDGDGLVRVLDWGDTPRPWIATEFVDRRLPSQGRLTAVEGLDHARTLTRALVEVHHHGIVHGGIDPQTVGYPPNTLDGVVEPMLDNVGLLPVYRRYADPGQYLDIRYSAPEVLDSRYGSVDHATDIYQLGMTLYRALTASPPFETLEDIERRVCEEQPPPPTERNPELPPEIDRIIRKATAKQKLLRYETALQFHTELRALRDGT
jgi:hypothetical protein